MSGNVWEWCWDWYGSISSTTGASGASGFYRVLQGGCWCKNADKCEVADRDYDFPYERYEGRYGFRVVRNAQ